MSGAKRLKMEIPALGRVRTASGIQMKLACRMRNPMKALEPHNTMHDNVLLQHLEETRLLFRISPARNPTILTTPSGFKAARDCSMVSGPPISRTWSIPTPPVRALAFSAQADSCLYVKNVVRTELFQRFGLCGGGGRCDDTGASGFDELCKNALASRSLR